MMTMGMMFVQSNSGINAEDFRTVMTTLTAAGVIGLLGLVWRMRDNVRDLVNEVGTSDKKGSLVHRVDGLETRVGSVENRNRSIDLVMRQYVRDMRKIGDGGGQRASDKTLQEAVEIAFAEDPDEPNN